MVVQILIDERRPLARRARSPAAAEHFIERAHGVPESLELGIAGQHRVLLMKGERLRRPDADVFLPRMTWSARRK